MRVISINLNGIRSASRKAFFPWLAQQNADFVCMQETRIQDEQLTDEMRAPHGYQSLFHQAEKKGYSGVGIYTKHTPDRVHYKLGEPQLDSEGRFLQIDIGKLSIISVYFPSGTSGDVRQGFKYKMMNLFTDWLKARSKDGREYLICGDWNIAHKPIDLKNDKANQKNSGFLPEEREWLDHIFEDIGYMDVFRKLNSEDGQYTWWSNRGQAWDRNVGWRIDYHISTLGLGNLATGESIYKDERFSDHAPLTIDYNYPL